MKKRAWLSRAAAGGVTLVLGMTLAACGAGDSGSGRSGSFHVLVHGDASKG